MTIEPTQHEAVTTFPDARHPAKEERDEQGQIGDSDHSRQHHDRSVDDKEFGIPGLPLLSHCPF